MEKQQIGLVTSVVVNVVLAVLLIFFIYKLNATSGTAEVPGTASPAAKALMAPDLGCVQVDTGDALLIIDVQNDFMPERPFTAQNPRHPPASGDMSGSNLKAGSLPVGEAKDIVSHINPLVETFEAAKGTIIYSLDWHPVGHCSFDASNPFIPVTPSTSGFCKDNTSIKMLNQGTLIRWPVHCVQGTWGAQFDPHLKISQTGASYVVKKGFWPHFDSYSAFGGMLSTHVPASNNVIVDESATSEDMTLASKRLADILKERKVKRLFLVGIATDVCVKNSVEDALLAAITEIPGLVIATVKDAVGGVKPEESKNLFSNWQGRGVAVLGDKNKEGKSLFNTKC